MEFFEFQRMIESLPTRRGKAEEIRQKRIFQSIESTIQKIREDEISEIIVLSQKRDLSQEEKSILAYLKGKHHPSEVEKFSQNGKIIDSSPNQTQTPQKP